MAFLVELVGGPADGEVRSLPEDRRAITLLSPVFQAPSFREADDTSPADSIVKTVESTYLRTKKFSASGNRIYQYMK